jgi:transcriptional regulator with XRE-family HTH domain
VPATFAFIENDTAKLNVIGSQVRKLRERKGWTQSQLAVKLQLFGWDTSQDSVSRLENQGRRVPDLELFVLGKVLDVKMEDLFPPNLRGKIKALWPHYRVKLSRGQLPPGIEKLGREHG